MIALTAHGSVTTENTLENVIFTFSQINNLKLGRLMLDVDFVEVHHLETLRKHKVTEVKNVYGSMASINTLCKEIHQDNLSSLSKLTSLKTKTASDIKDIEFLQKALSLYDHTQYN